ncbi:MAG TPA: PadR family transcriptional regulator [Solirubrobacteraceae bacterium]|jgi:DNA-binding PadR family transcriptional regulator
MAGHRGGGPAGHWGWGGFDRGPGFGPGRGGPHRRGRRARGDVRAAILLLLDEQPRNGYGVMQEVEERSSGEWRPSSGSVYPALAQLEDEGLVAPADGEQGKAFALTEAGRAYVAEHRERLGVPWEDATEGMPAGLRELRQAVGQVAMASMQVGQTDPRLIDSARAILDDARKALYRLLAGDHEPRDAE